MLDIFSKMSQGKIPQQFYLISSKRPWFELLNFQNSNSNEIFVAIILKKLPFWEYKNKFSLVSLTQTNHSKQFFHIILIFQIKVLFNSEYELYLETTRSKLSLRKNVNILHVFFRSR